MHKKNNTFREGIPTLLYESSLSLSLDSPR